MLRENTWEASQKTKVLLKMMLVEPDTRVGGCVALGVGGVERQSSPPSWQLPSSCLCSGCHADPPAYGFSMCARTTWTPLLVGLCLGAWDVASPHGIGYLVE